MSALRPAEPIDLAADIGEQTLSDFQTYVLGTGRYLGHEDVDRQYQR